MGTQHISWYQVRWIDKWNLSVTWFTKPLKGSQAKHKEWFQAFLFRWNNEYSGFSISKSWISDAALETSKILQCYTTQVSLETRFALFERCPMIYFTEQMISYTKKVPITKSCLKTFMVSSLTKIHDANLWLLRLEVVQTVSGTNINTHEQWIFRIFKFEIMNFLFHMQNT